MGLDLFRVFVKKDDVGWSRIVRRWMGVDSSSDIYIFVLGKTWPAKNIFHGVKWARREIFRSLHDMWFM